MSRRNMHTRLVEPRHANGETASHVDCGTVASGSGMIWGYAGVFPGEFGLWKGDQTMNKLRFMVDNGFGSTGIGLGLLREPRRREQIGEFVARHDLCLTPHLGMGYFSEPIDSLRRTVDRLIWDLRTDLELLRAPIATTCVGPYHRFMDSPTLPEQMDRLEAVLTPLAEALWEMGCPLGIENHGDYYCSDLVELCGRVPHLGLFLDTGNTYLIGEKPVPACREAAPYTIGTHFKDHRVYPQPRDGLSFQIDGAPLGEGHVGLRDIYMDLLRLCPAPSRLVMQWEMVPPKGMDPWECLHRSQAFVDSLPQPEMRA